jgi:AcrR family transcriptional regulator
MAAAKKKTRPSKKTDTRSIDDRLIDAALALAAGQPWHTLSLPEIASHAGVPLGEALLTLPSLGHIQRALIDRVDRKVFLSLEDDPLDGSVRDKLFDILMRRFDAMDGHQAALKSMRPVGLRNPLQIPLQLSLRDPLATACLGARLLKSMAMSLQAAGVSADGCLGALKTKALAAIQLNAMRVWIDDDDPCLARTMAALDKGLARAEKFASRRSAAETPASETA